MSNAVHAPSTRVHVGLQGAGKTYAIEQEVEQTVLSGTPVAVVDRMYEWGDVGSKIKDLTWGVSSVAEIPKAVERGYRLIVVRPDDVDHAGVSEAAAGWALSHPGLAGVAIPEAHHVLPGGTLKLPPNLDKAITARRHFQTILWLDTQRLSRLNITAVELADVTRIFAVSGRRDRQVLRELCDTELVDRVNELTERFALGQKGWHVRLGPARLPPYEIVRL